jgi:ketosteroid isomerase-like protein
MNRVLPLALAVLGATTATACTPGAKAATDTGKIEQAIKAQEAQWQQDYAKRDLNALAGHYADDAVFGGPGDPLATTDVARRQALQGLVDDPNMKLTFASDRVQVAQSGDLAYSRGGYTMQLTDKATNKPVTSKGTYLTVWDKQTDGSWKAVEDFVTPGPAPAAK